MTAKLSPDVAPLPLVPPGADADTRPAILNLGCGNKHVAGAINLDVTRDTNPDIVHDLDRRPWPFPDGAFDRIIAHDVIEHLDDIVGTFEEIHRIARPGALVSIVVPHFSSANAYTDPTHRHYFGYLSCAYFTGAHEFSFYTRVKFREIRTRIMFYPTVLNKLVWRMAAKWPLGYERRWAWMFPAWYLYFELEVLKPGLQDPP